MPGRLSLCAVVLAATGCNGGGCAGMTPLPDGFPAAERNPKAVQARVTSSGLQFIEDNAATLIESLLPAGLAFDVPPSCLPNPDDLGVCCGAAPGDCVILVDLQPQTGDPPRLELTPDGSRSIGMVLRARMQTQAPLPFEYDVGLFTVTCDASIDTTASGEDSLTVTTALDFSQDPTAGTTRADLGTVDVTDLETGDVSITGGFDCFIAGLFVGAFIPDLEAQLESQLSGLVGEQLCKQCTSDNECAPFGTCQQDVCMLDGGARCLQELGITGRLAASTLLGSLSPGQEGAIDLYDVAGGYARTNDDGLSLGLLGGARAADGRHDPCVPVVPPPSLGDLPEAAVFQGNARLDTAAPFHLGIGVSQEYLELAAWAAYDSGFLCANVGTRSVALLTTEAFALLAPSLIDMLHGDPAPMILALRPQEPPTVALGAGTFTTGPGGERTLVEPLMTITLPRLDIDVYILVDQRFIRLMTLTSDVTLPLGLDVNGTGQIVPVFGSLDGAFTNVSVTDSDLLLEEPEAIAQRFPAILSLALPFLADALQPIDLPDIMGILLVVAPGGITSAEGNQFLAVYADLAIGGTPKRGASEPTQVNTSAEIVELSVPTTEDYGVDDHVPRSRTSVTLALGAKDAPRAPLEWQFRIDEGLWSPYTPSPTVTLSRDVLWLEARHHVEVRARVQGDPSSADPTPAVVEFLVDHLAPRVDLAFAAGGVAVEATDFVSPADALSVAYRFGDGPWISAGAPPVFVPTATPETLEVAVTDEAGNVGVATGAEALFHGRGTSGGDCSCRAGSPDGTTGGALVLVACAAILLALRRRATLLPVMLAFVAAFVTMGCGGDEPGVERGPTGRWSDIAADDDRVVVSAYEEAFGDLVLGEAHGGDIDWQVVDGVPAGGIPVFPANGYRGGVTLPGEDVGAWTSVALFGGVASIAYQHRETGALQFAVEEPEMNGWTTHVVDDAAFGPVGLYASLTLDAAGVPGIAYLAYPVENADGTRSAELRWAQARSANPASAADWTVEILAQTQVPCAGMCAAGEACVAATDTCTPTVATCTPACTGDNECVGGTCVAILPDPNVVDLPEGTGLFASAARLPDGRPVVAFHDRENGDLNLAVYSGSWTIVPLDASPATDTGQWSTVAVDATGNVHVAYQDALGDRLLVATWNGTSTTIEVIDDGLRDDDRPHPVGASAALVIDPDGRPAVAYQDALQSDLLFARHDGTAWAHDDLLSGDEGFGFFTAATVGDGEVWVSTYVYDRDAEVFGELRIVKMPEDVGGGGCGCRTGRPVGSRATPILACALVAILATVWLRRRRA